MIMTANNCFGWRKKAGEKVCKRKVTAFESEAAEEEDADVKSGEIDWISLAAKRRVISLEDAVTKSERLRNEGITLADSERYWEAIKKWDEAILLNPVDERLYEMKAQALLILCEVFPAVFTAEKAIKANPMWWVSYQTMGRAQLGLGEVTQALKYFQKAIHLNPAEKELWEEDLKWALSLREESLVLKEEKDLKQDDEVVISEVYSDEEEETINQKTEHVVETNSSENLDPRTGKETVVIPKGYVLMRN